MRSSARTIAALAFALLPLAPFFTACSDEVCGCVSTLLRGRYAVHVTTVDDEPIPQGIVVTFRQGAYPPFRWPSDDPMAAQTCTFADPKTLVCRFGDPLLDVDEGFVHVEAPGYLPYDGEMLYDCCLGTIYTYIVLSKD